MDLKKWLETVKEKGNVAFEIGKLNIKKVNLERRISKLQCRLGERVYYLFKLDKNVMEDDIVKGFVEEIKFIENEIEEIGRKIEALKKAKEQVVEIQEKTEEKVEEVKTE